MGFDELITKARRRLGVEDGASLAAVRQAYLSKTFVGKFRGFIIGEDGLENEFVALFEAYARILKNPADGDSRDPGEQLSTEDMFRLTFNHGVYLLINEKLLEASEKFQQAHRMNSRDVPLLTYLGFILFKRRNYYAAEKYLTQALQLDEHNADGYWLLGEVYHKSGNAAKAMKMYEKARQLNPARTGIAHRIKEIRQTARGGRKIRGKRHPSLFSRLFNRSDKRDG